MMNGPQEPSRDILVEDREQRPAAPAREVPANHTASNVRRRVLRRHVKILFISANTRTDQQLSLNEEYRKIERVLESAKYRDAFELVPQLAVQTEDLQRALLKHRPGIVHFACHGSDKAELVLLTKDGTPARVPAEALASYFRILRDNVALVVLNACFASEQASAIRASIGMAIGMREKIADEAAITFSGALYESLAFGRSIRESFDLATTAISAFGSGQRNVPELFERTGLDASALCLVGERPSWPRWPLWSFAAAAVCVLGVLGLWRCGPGHRDAIHVIDARPVPDAPGPILPPSDMACFTRAKVRAGIFDTSQRPQKCRELTPTDDCMRQQDPSIPEIALDDFCLDKHEVTNQELASWLEGKPEMWRPNTRDPAVIQTRTEPTVFLVRTGDECGLTLVNGRVRPGPGKASQPATCMTWMAARDYCRALDKQLPLELEWEFAAKGHEGRAFPWGTTMPRLDGVAFDRGDSTEKHPVDVGASNQDVSPEGVHDLGGNVAEWVADGGGSGETATIRGGSWNSRDPCRLLGSSCKRVQAEEFSRDVGFRCAKRVPKEKARE